MEKREPSYCWWECKLVQPFWKTGWKFLKTLKTELSYDPAIAQLGINPKGTDGVIQRGTCIPTFIAAISTISTLWKKLKCPSIDEWKKKMWFIYAMAIYSVIRKDEYLPLALTWMELEGIMLSEMSQAEKDKYHMVLWNSVEDHRGRDRKLNEKKSEGRQAMSHSGPQETN